MEPPAIIVIGVSGSGKSTVAAAIAGRIGGTCLDADDFHPPANIAKMSAGIPLDDADRAPWLLRLADEIARHRERGEAVVLACSALKEKYRALFRESLPGVRFVYLKGSFELILARMQSRPGHFMKPQMLRSQFADLEEPADAIIADISLPPDEVVDRILESPLFPHPPINRD